ncbi:hypothetical protein TNCV_1461361 [Trichonephila clavipes]|nr:hypothetical protein TNCV_1461361 [Trichonephila clavipes]
MACGDALREFLLILLGIFGPAIELFHSHPSQEETMICRLAVEVKNRGVEEKGAESLKAVLLREPPSHIIIVMFPEEAAGLGGERTIRLVACTRKGGVAMRNLKTKSEW